MAPRKESKTPKKEGKTPRKMGKTPRKSLPNIPLKENSFFKSISEFQSKVRRRDSLRSIKHSKIPHSTAKEALDIALRYVEQEKSSSALDTFTGLLLRKWRDFASRNRFARSSQKKLTDKLLLRKWRLYQKEKKLNSKQKKLTDFYQK